MLGDSQGIPIEGPTGLPEYCPSLPREFRRRNGVHVFASAEPIPG